MLRIGLTGGIGAGKSTVSAMLVDHGAVLIDADKIAREVVEPGQPLLEKLAEAFGPQVLHPDGSLDRPALASAAFVDSEHTAQLNGLMHPAIRDRTAEHFARHADAEIVVHDVPLLVENSMTPAYHLNLLVDVPAEVRLQRLMDSRGMDRDDAAARISRQADDETRRSACDVIIDNSGSVEKTKAAVGRLIETRIRPFAANLASGQRAPKAALELVDSADADWAGDAQRVLAKLRFGTGDEFAIDHIGSTSVPGLPAKDVIDLQLIVPDLTAARDLAPRLAELGYPGTELSDHLGEGGTEPKWFHANTDGSGRQSACAHRRLRRCALRPRIPGPAHRGRGGAGPLSADEARTHGRSTGSGRYGRAEDGSVRRVEGTVLPRDASQARARQLRLTR